MRRLTPAFDQAAAVIVLMTPDDIVQLGDEFASGPDAPETAPSRQARPNVLFEDGIAFGRHPKQTV
ncbi:TIR domain-containing protein [Gordonia terrae]